MKCNAEPYEGSQPYIFVSYCHQDQVRVYSYIEMLAREGYRIWYDEGITPGDEWTENIARHLEGCSVFVAFVTEDSLNSHNCRQEINFAALKNKNIVALYLDDVCLSAGMEMLLSGRQGIYRSRYPLPAEFIAKLTTTEGFGSCKGMERPEIQVGKRIGIDEKTLTVTMNTGGLTAPNTETYLLYVSSQEKIHIRKSSFTIGRSEAHSDYVINGEPSISRSHMTVRKMADRYSVIDNHSMNHVGINGELIAPGMEYDIAGYDIISLAKQHMVFFQNYDEELLDSAREMGLRQGDTVQILEKLPVIRIGSRIIDRNGCGNEICLTGEGIEEFHALLIRTPRGIYAADISGTGETALDGQPLAYGKKTLMKLGSVLRIGDRELELVQG